MSCTAAAGSTSAGPRASRWPRRSSRGDALRARPRARGSSRCPPASTSPGRSIAGLDARLAGPAAGGGRAHRDLGEHPPRAPRARRRFAAGPARLLPRIRVVTELADDPLRRPDLPPPVPALRRKLELARLVGRLIEAEPELGARHRGLRPRRQPGRAARRDAGRGGRRRRRSPRVDAGRARRALAAQPALPRPHRRLRRGGRRRQAGPDARRGRGAGRGLGGRSAAGAPGDRRGLDRLARGDAGLHGGGGAAAAGRAGAAGLRRDAARGGLGSGSAPTTPAPRTIRSTASGGWPTRSASTRRRCRPGTRPRRRRRSATPSSRWRCARRRSPTSGAARAGRWPAGSAPPAPALDLDRGARPARRGAGDRAGAARGGGDTASARRWSRRTGSLARRVTAELDRWGLIPDDSAGRPLALTPPGVLLRLLAALPGAPLTPEALLVLLKHPLVNSAPGARGAHLAPDRAAGDRAAARRRALDRLGRPGRLGGRGGRRGAGLDRLAARRRWRRSLRRRARRWPSRWRATAPRPRRSPPGRRGGAHAALGQGGRAGRRGRCSTRWRPRPTPAACSTPAEYRALVQSLMAGARRAGGGGRHPSRHRDLGHARGAGAVGRPHRARRAERGHLAAAAGRGPVARPRRSAARSACRAPSGRSACRRTTSSRRWARRRVVLTRAHPRRRGADRRLALAAAAGEPARRARAGGRGGARRREGARRGLAGAGARGSTCRPRRVPPEPRARRRGRRWRRGPAELSVTQIETLVRDPYAVYAPRVLRPEAARSARAQGRRARARQRDPCRAGRASSPRRSRACPTTPRRSSARRSQAALAEAAPWPAVNAIWTARLRRSAPLVPRRRGRAPRPRQRRRRARSRGRRAVDGLAQPFAVTAKADRIDRAPDGRYAIYDYKSGERARAPTEAAAIHLQLPLEAAIARGRRLRGAAGGAAPPTWSCSASTRASPAGARRRPGRARRVLGAVPRS